MNWRDLRLLYKQAIAFSIILLGAIGTNLYTLSNLEDIKDNVDAVHHNWLPSVVAISNINVFTSDFRIAELQHASGLTERDREYYERVMTEIRTEIVKNQKAYRKLIIYDDEKELFESFEKNWEKYLLFNQRFLLLSNESKPVEAIFLLNGEARQHFDKSSEILHRLVSINEKGSFYVTNQAEGTLIETKQISVLLLISTTCISVLITFLLVKNIVGSMQILEKASKKLAQGEDILIDIKQKDEIGMLAMSFQEMSVQIREDSWLKNGQKELNEQLQNCENLDELAEHMIKFIISQLNVEVAAFYFYDWAEDKLTLQYHHAKGGEIEKEFSLGEGIIGQAAMSQKEIFWNIGEDLVEHLLKTKVGSFGEFLPTQIVAIPLLWEGKLKGVLEIGSFKPLSTNEINFLRYTANRISLTFKSLESGRQINALLMQAQKQAEELRLLKDKILKTQI